MALPGFFILSELRGLYMHLRFASTHELNVVLPGLLPHQEIQSFNCTCVLLGFKSLFWLYGGFHPARITELHVQVYFGFAYTSSLWLYQDFHVVKITELQMHLHTVLLACESLLWFYLESFATP